MNGKPVYEVPAKGIINFESGFGKKLLCDGLTFTTGSACAFSCSFCYVEAMMQKSKHVEGIKEKFEDVVIRRKGAIEAMRSQLYGKGSTPKFYHDSRTIYASPLVDVAANMDLVYETVEACRLILRMTGWTIRLLSKSNLLPKIAQLLDQSFTSPDLKRAVRVRIIFGVSTGTLDDGLARVFEKGTALVSKRIESLHWLQDNGFRTYGMICPSLPQESYLKFAHEMAVAIRADKCEHIWAEPLNARGESFERTHAALEAAGFEKEARSLKIVSSDKIEWEIYARQTFEAHADIYRNQKIDGQPKLRFLQYANKANETYWNDRVKDGAVLL